MWVCGKIMKGTHTLTEAVTTGMGKLWPVGRMRPAKLEKIILIKTKS